MCTLQELTEHSPLHIGLNITTESQRNLWLKRYCNYREQISKEPAELGKDSFGWDVYTIHEDFTRLVIVTS